MASSLDLNDIRLLMQVVEHGSYSAASRAIGVPKSTISQRIAALEQAVGTGLLRRTSRSFSLTEAGSILLPHARAIEDLARKVERALLEQGQEIVGTLRISTGSALAQFVLSNLVPRFLGQHPDVTIRLEATNRDVDLIGEGFDMTLRSHSGPLRDSSLVQRVVGRAAWSIVAAPAWLALNRAPAAPEDIQSDSLLCFSTTRECPDWRLFRGTQEVEIRPMPRLISDDVATLRASTLAGGGIACLPLYTCSNALRSGSLVRILPDWAPVSSTLSVLTPPKAQSSRLARAFSAFLALELPRVMNGWESAYSTADQVDLFDEDTAPPVFAERLLPAPLVLTALRA